MDSLLVSKCDQHNPQNVWRDLLKVSKLHKLVEFGEQVTCRSYVTSFLNLSEVSNKGAFVLTL